MTVDTQVTTAEWIALAVDRGDVCPECAHGRLFGTRGYPYCRHGLAKMREEIGDRYGRVSGTGIGPAVCDHGVKPGECDACALARDCARLEETL